LVACPVGTCIPDGLDTPKIGEGCLFVLMLMRFFRSHMTLLIFMRCEERKARNSASKVGGVSLTLGARLVSVAIHGGGYPYAPTPASP
jgi:hypothetical protein